MSRGKRRKGKLVPGVITVPPWSWKIKVLGPRSPGLGGLESETVTELGAENDCSGEGQQQLYTIDPSSRQRRCYIRNITARAQLKNNTDPESYIAWLQDELIGGKR
jgi:hypothetical protein